MRRALTATLMLACGSAMSGPAIAGPPGHGLWQALSPLCGQAFAGELVQGTDPGDADFVAGGAVMHVAGCEDDEIRIPLVIGDDRSRVWVLTRGDHGVRLKHEHSHEDGSPDEVTLYGGDAEGDIRGADLRFPADAYTAEMLPAAATNVWIMRVEDGVFYYELHRYEQDRHFVLAFNLTEAVAAPEAPWGSPQL